MLLEMLGLEERALGPENSVVPAHESSWTGESRVTRAGSLHGHGDRPCLDADGECGPSLRRNRRRIAPAGILQVAERGYHTDELRVCLELPQVRSDLSRSQVVLLAPDQVAAERLLLFVEEGEEIRGVERRERLELVHAHHNGRGATSEIGVGRRLRRDRAPQEWSAAPAAHREGDAANEWQQANGPAHASPPSKCA